MAETTPKPRSKSTFRRLDKYLYVAGTADLPPATVIAVCVMRNSGRSPRMIGRLLKIDLETVKHVLMHAAPFLRKRRATA